MSWEKFENEIPCSCGKGKVIVTTEMDDWNRSRSYETILCNECREKRNREIEHKMERDKRFAELSSQVISYFNSRYLENWLSYFKKMKSKKDVWQIVSKMNIETCSLSTFYSRCKFLTMEDYIRSLIKLEHIPKIIKELNIQDEKLKNLLVEPLEIFEEKHNEMINEAYRNLK